MIEFSCRCGEPLAAEEEHAGAEVQCPQCGKVLSVPGGGPKKGKLVDDDDPPRRRRRKRRRDDEKADHVKRLMDKAHDELDEEEDRHRREGGGIALTPGIITGGVMFILGAVLFIAAIFVYPCFWVLVAFGFLALSGLVRLVLAYRGEGYY